jgi:glycosyltransferase involved in cell wall biosynthesis
LANATSHPHKNLKSLVVAFLELVKDKKFKHNLVLIGIHGIAYKEIDSIIEASGSRNRVIFTNTWIDHSKMKYFNRLADIFVMPSLYEGFGLPSAEAMACGTPIIASKYSCTPEIVGNAGMVIDVKKPKLIAKSIKYLLRNSKLRQRYSNEGKKRAVIFSWKEMGKTIYNLYND